MKTVLFDVSDETLVELTKSLNEQHKDSLLVLAPFSGNLSVHAPSNKGKYKGYHRFKMEVWIPEDAIKGEDALIDFGGLTLLRLPKNRVQDHLKK
jgi:hypothetical protein